MERTEDEKLHQSPVIVTLGGKDYEIPPLVIRDARKWRLKTVGVLAGLSGNPPKVARWRRLLGAKVQSYFDATTDDPEAFDKALHYLLVTMQDVTMDLFFDYAKGLNRKEIEATATEEDIEVAFSRIVEIAFPLSKSLPMIKKKLYQ